nr:MAG TPA: hypothetical protein [Caudoviricetes sp.]
MREFINGFNKEECNLAMEFIFSTIDKLLKKENIDEHTPIYYEEGSKTWVLDIDKIHKKYNGFRVVALVNKDDITGSSFIVMQNEFKVCYDDYGDAVNGVVLSITAEDDGAYLLSVLDHRYHNDHLINFNEIEKCRPIEGYYLNMINKVPVSRIYLYPGKEEYRYIEAMFIKSRKKAIKLIASTNEEKHNKAIDFIKGLKND